MDKKINTVSDGGYSSASFDDKLKFYIDHFNSELEKACRDFSSREGNGILSEAMAYSLKAGGKRIRPVLAFEFCRMCKGNIEDALPAALAIEMIHTFSLIHDDLPCMDDDDFRRGRPSCHKAFGEAVGLLAGDALAFEACRIAADMIPDGSKAKAVISQLCSCSLGMIKGQVIDISGVTPEQLTDMYALKTSMLIKAACVCGCILAGADEKVCKAAEEYGYELGLAFQITDDILDVTGDESQLGKPIGSDEKAEKLTYVSLYGLDTAAKFAREHTDKALSALKKFDDREFTEILTDKLLGRNK